MKWRFRPLLNWKVRDTLRRSRKPLILGSSALLILIFGIIFFNIQDSGELDTTKLIPKTDLTGAAVAQQAGDQQPQTISDQQAQPQSDSDSDSTSPSSTSDSAPSNSDDREFYEYKEDCAQDMKKYSDDVEDVSTQVDEYAAALDALQKEYDQKITDLQQQYQVPLDNAQVKKEKAERDLEGVLQQWNERKAYCDQKYPA